MLALAASTAACASMPEASSPMTIGSAAAAPRGYVAFCERQPQECGASATELAAMHQASTGSSTSVAAISYDWSQAFAEAHAARGDNTAPAEPAVAQPIAFDWSQAFAKSSDVQVSADQPRDALAAGMPAVETSIQASTVKLDSRNWSLLTKANEKINRAIAERSDREIYGVSELWARPLSAGLTAGDCEDYVLEKRHALIQAGLPAQALSIAVVQTLRGDTHAVLVVATDKGDYVLDNLRAWVLPWTKTSYTWRERQVEGSASHWAYAASPAQHSAPATSGLLLASLR